MILRFGEWYVTPDDADSQISNYEVTAMSLSHLYIMMVAADKGYLIPPSGETMLVVGIMEHLTVADRLVSAKDTGMTGEKKGDMIDQEKA